MALTREYLKGLSIEAESIEGIMKEHGKTLTAVQKDLAAKESEAEELQAQITQRDKDLEELRNDDRLKLDTSEKEEFQKRIAELEEKYASDTEALTTKIAEGRKAAAIELEITRRGARNAKAVQALIDHEVIKLEGENVEGIAEQLDQLQKDEPYLFKPQNEPSGQSSVGGNPSRGGGGEIDAFAAAAEKFTK